MGPSPRPLLGNVWNQSLPAWHRIPSPMGAGNTAGVLIDCGQWVEQEVGTHVRPGQTVKLHWAPGARSALQVWTAPAPRVGRVRGWWDGGGMGWEAG